MDDSIKSVMIDSSKPVKNVVETIGQKLDLKNAEEYAVRRATAGESTCKKYLLYSLDHFCHFEPIWSQRARVQRSVVFGVATVPARRAPSRLNSFTKSATEVSHVDFQRFRPDC
jgi:hypothetical protein